MTPGLHPVWRVGRAVGQGCWEGRPLLPMLVPGGWSPENFCGEQVPWLLPRTLPVEGQLLVGDPGTSVGCCRPAICYDWFVQVWDGEQGLSHLADPPVRPGPGPSLQARPRSGLTEAKVQSVFTDPRKQV